MNEFDEIQNLIRLKRHETPPHGFVEDFVSAFRERQRAEMLQRSARSLLWERITTYFADMLNPKLAWTVATFAALALLGISLRPVNQGTGGQVAQNRDDAFEVNSFTATDPNAFKSDVESYLRAVEFEVNGGMAPSLVMKPQIFKLRTVDQKGGAVPVDYDLSSGRIFQH